ncbi:hypothetical protein D4Q76_03310 [archaeon]|nr:MAG: hypothetical protein D4Q76_03310 [archaeon]
MNLELAHEMEELKGRVVMLERLVLTMVSVEKISRKDLTKEQRTLFDETLDDIMNKRYGRFISFEQFKKRVGS